MARIEENTSSSVISFLSMVYHNLRHNLFHSPTYKNADNSKYFQVFLEDEIEVVFKSDLRFMCVYGIHAEVYSFRSDTKNFLLVRKGKQLGEYLCEWITTDRVVHDRAYLKITNNTFVTFCEHLYDLRVKIIRGQRNQRNYNFDLHQDSNWYCHL